MEDQEGYDRKLTWMRSLRVGDTVNDCHYRNQRIVAITERRINRIGTDLLYVLPSWLIPDGLPAGLVSFVDRWCAKIFGTEVYDRMLELEDGSCCSAMNCCNPIGENT